MEERSISVGIAGRAYPLSVQPHEEENVRQAALEINESIDLDVEFGIALNDFARHYLCGGLSFYIR
jgi:hypothetical protein